MHTNYYTNNLTEVDIWKNQSVERSIRALLQQDITGW